MIKKKSFNGFSLFLLFLFVLVSLRSFDVQAACSPGLGTCLSVGLVERVVIDNSICEIQDDTISLRGSCFQDKRCVAGLDPEDLTALCWDGDPPLADWDGDGLPSMTIEEGDCKERDASFKEWSYGTGWYAKGKTEEQKVCCNLHDPNVFRIENVFRNPGVPSSSGYTTEATTVGCCPADKYVLSSKSKRETKDLQACCDRDDKIY